MDYWNLNHYNITFVLWLQVREAIGVTLSVLCSNIRLHMSYCDSHSHEGCNNDVANHLKEQSWVRVLTERASEAVLNIQNSSHSDGMDINSVETSTQNGHLNGVSVDDVKWMETVLVFDWFLL